MKTLLDARMMKGWSQQQLAETVNMTQTAISQIENGKAIPHPNTKRRLELVFNTKLKFERRSK